MAEFRKSTVGTAKCPNVFSAAVFEPVSMPRAHCPPTHWKALSKLVEIVIPRQEVFCGQIILEDSILKLYYKFNTAGILRNFKIPVPTVDSF